MPEPIIAATPPANGQVPANPATPGANQPSPANPDGANNNPNGGQKIEVDLKELEALKRDAGRWNAHQSRNREDRRASRRSPENQMPAGADDEAQVAIRERDTLISTLTSKATQLEVKDQLRDIFSGDDYKSIPESLKRAIIKNPLGFANANSSNSRDIVADIQDFLDDELDSLELGGNSTPAKIEPENPNGSIKTTPENRPTPPAGVTPPTSPNDNLEVDIVGKSGPARSTAVLQGLFKRAGLGQKQ